MVVTRPSFQYSEARSPIPRPATVLKFLVSKNYIKTEINKVKYLLKHLSLVVTIVTWSLKKYTLSLDLDVLSLLADIEILTKTKRLSSLLIQIKCRIQRKKSKMITYLPYDKGRHNICIENICLQPINQ